MTPAEWDAHKAKWCASCRYLTQGARVCPFVAKLNVAPDDEWTCRAFERLGRCSQWMKEPEVKARKGRRKWSR